MPLPKDRYDKSMDLVGCLQNSLADVSDAENSIRLVLNIAEELRLLGWRRVTTWELGPKNVKFEDEKGRTLGMC